MATETETIDSPEFEKEHMKTMVSCNNTLTKIGFVTQFKATPAGLLSMKTEKIFQPHEIKVPRYYRFEGESNPSDNSILYAIEANDGEKGTLVDGYGTSSDMHVANFMKNVPIEKKEEVIVSRTDEQDADKEHTSWIGKVIGELDTEFPLSGAEGQH